MFLRKLLFLLLIIPINSFAKEKPPAFISKILNYPGPVFIYNFKTAVPTMPLLQINDLPGTFKFSGQALTKNKKGLFLNHLGTGRIYQWSGNSQDGYWKRIDSTFFTGYNFLSILFSVDSTIYSFGGIGFWYQNGNVRQFSFESQEWNAKLLNKSIPWHKSDISFFYIDTLNKNVYFNDLGRYHDTSLKDYIDSARINKIYRISLIDGAVSELGRSTRQKGSFFGITPWGSLTTNDKIVDVLNNRMYTLSEHVQNNLLRVLAKSNKKMFEWQYCFWMDSALYFGDPHYGYDSVIIHKKDLISTGETFYSPEKSTK